MKGLLYILVLGSCHLEEPCAAKTVIELIVRHISEVMLYRQDLGRGNPSQLVPHAGQGRAQGVSCLE